MSQIAQQAFIANAQSVLIFDRYLTADESAALSNIKKNAIASGEQCSPQTVTNGEAGITYTSLFSNLATAQAVASAANAFVPAPTSATATTI